MNIERLRNTTTLLVAILLLAPGLTLGQEHKMAVSGSKTLKIQEVNKVEIQGYDGNEIVFTTTDRNRGQNERAQGLTAISSMGLKDNTGIGLSLQETGDVINVFPLSKRSSRQYLIQVPRNVKVAYEHSSSYGSGFRVRDVTSELEVSTNHNSVTLTNVTGPMTINTVHGKIEAIFSAVNQSSPISIVSVHGLIDLSLPKDSKANLRISSGWGEIYTDLDIDLDQTDSELRSNSTRIGGKLNGGGVMMEVSTSHSNIYLRARK